MTPDEVREIVDSISVLMVQDIDLAMVKRAIETHKKYGITYWDALIVSAAERADCESILSEDLNEGQAYHEVRVRNPFNEGIATD